MKRRASLLIGVLLLFGCGKSASRDAEAVAKVDGNKTTVDDAATVDMHQAVELMQAELDKEQSASDLLSEIDRRRWESTKDVLLSIDSLDFVAYGTADRLRGKPLIDEVELAKQASNDPTINTREVIKKALENDVLQQKVNELGRKINSMLETAGLPAPKRRTYLAPWELRVDIEVVRMDGGGFRGVARVNIRREVETIDHDIIFHRTYWAPPYIFFLGDSDEERARVMDHVSAYTANCVELLIEYRKAEGKQQQ